MSDTTANSPVPPREPAAPRVPWWLVASLALSGLSVVVPHVSLPALGGSVFAALLAERGRVALGLPSVLLALVGVGRFMAGWAFPSIVAMGTHAAGERAMSVLREVAWAERVSLEARAVDRDADGRPEFLPLAELTHHALAPRTPVPSLRPENYQPLREAPGIEPGVFQVGGFAVMVYLPRAGGGGATIEKDGVDPAGARHRFVAYAWPAERPGGVEAAKKERVFFVDEAETLCEAPNVNGYLGRERHPEFDAALSEPSFDGPRCGAGRDGAPWKRWKRRR